MTRVLDTTPFCYITLAGTQSRGVNVSLKGIAADGGLAPRETNEIQALILVHHRAMVMGGAGMAFPGKQFNSIISYFDAYADEVRRALASVSREALMAVEAFLAAAIKRDAQIFACGNGGSAAISNHLVCDHAKGIRTDTSLLPRVHSLSENVELMTAISNDISFDEVFAYQLASIARSGDVLITISASGNSENIVRAIQWAREHNIYTIAMTGFSGGRSAGLSDLNLHVSCENYGVVEDVHQSLMHVLAQYIRLSHMPEGLIAERNF